MEYMCKSSNIVYEKSPNIPIKKQIINNKYEQSLNISFFDPHSKSPPNLFVSKLKARMNKHYEFKNDFKLTKA